MALMRGAPFVAMTGFMGGGSKAIYIGYSDIISFNYGEIKRYN